MEYTQLAETYKYDTLAEAIYGRELEYFHYDFDRINFEHLLEHAKDPALLQDVAERLVETKRQMGNVIAIINALRAQIDNEEAYAAAVVRMTEKRKAKEADA